MTTHKQVMLKSITLKKFTLTFFGLCLAVVSGVKTASAQTLQVVANGLENPRGIDFGPDGAIYVAEAGTGGTQFTIPGFPTGFVLNFGSTGAITRIQNGKQERILTGLPSLAELPQGVPVPTEQGSSLPSLGVHDIKFAQNGDVYVLYGYGSESDSKSTLGSAGADLGQIIKFHLNADGSLERRGAVADLVEYEQVNNPDGEDLLSDAYALKVQGDNLVVVESGGNDILRVDKQGNISLVNALPRGAIEGGITFQSVPTSVAIGRDGVYYVGELTGGPFPQGGARIFRIVPGQQPQVFVDGFTQIIGLDIDSKGNLYVLEYSTQPLLVSNNKFEGQLIRVSPDGVRTTLVSAGEGLIAPTHLRVGPDDAVYISNYGVTKGQGQVVRIKPKKSTHKVRPGK